MGMLEDVKVKFRLLIRPDWKGSVRGILLVRVGDREATVTETEVAEDSRGYGNNDNDRLHDWAVGVLADALGQLINEQGGKQ